MNSLRSVKGTIQYILHSLQVRLPNYCLDETTIDINIKEPATLVPGQPQVTPATLPHPVDEPSSPVSPVDPAGIIGAAVLQLSDPDIPETNPTIAIADVGVQHTALPGVRRTRYKSSF